MASSEAQGFVQGFAGTLAPVILERKKEARDFFNKQVEYARTVGLQNRQKVKQEADATLAIARQLEQINVPKEVIMAQINMDPGGLGNFYEGIDKLNRERASQNLPPLSAEEIAGLVNVGGNFKAPDEDLATFVSRTYEPISRAVRDPNFSANPENSLWASMMGYSAMDEARAELGNTVITDGLTAEDLINYGDAQPQKIGGQAVVTTNYAGLPADAEKLVTPNEANIIATAIEEYAMADSTLATMAIRGEVIPEEQVMRITADLSQSFPSISPEYIFGEVTRYIERRGGSVGTPTAPVEDTGMGDTPEPVMPPVEPPTASDGVDMQTNKPLSAQEIDEILSKSQFASSIQPAGNGKSTIVYTDGSTVVVDNDEIREAILGN